MKAEDNNRLDSSRPHKKYFLVTEGATTKQGGVVHVKERDGYIALYDKRVAVVGDYVQYPDGSIATIISGTGVSMLIENAPVAINQSVLDNGDVIEESGVLYKDLEIALYDDEAKPEGFLIKNWTNILSHNEKILHS